MLIYLLRHGLTAYNAEKRYQGQRDIPLSPEGRAQLCRADIQPKTVYITPLCRTRQTAEVLFPEADLVEVRDLQEMCFGSFEGRNFIEMEHDPDYLAWVDAIRMHLADLDATVAWAGRHGGNLKKVGITGFCWGGRITWLYAEQSPNVGAGVAWYGRLVGNPSALTPKHPVELAASLKAPVLGLYGGQDGGIPLTTVNQMKDALAEAGDKGNKAAKGSRFVVYPDAPHAFHADYRPSYRKAPAEDGWAQALEWFKAHGVK